jgi:hypothetical protein
MYVCMYICLYVYVHICIYVCAYACVGVMRLNNASIFLPSSLYNSAKYEMVSRVSVVSSSSVADKPSARTVPSSSNKSGKGSSKVVPDDLSNEPNPSSASKSPVLLPGHDEETPDDMGAVGCLDDIDLAATDRRDDSHGEDIV